MHYTDGIVQVFYKYNKFTLNCNCNASLRSHINHFMELIYYLDTDVMLSWSEQIQANRVAIAAV